MTTVLKPSGNHLSSGHYGTHRLDIDGMSGRELWLPLYMILRQRSPEEKQRKRDTDHTLATEPTVNIVDCRAMKLLQIWKNQSDFVAPLSQQSPYMGKKTTQAHPKACVQYRILHALLYSYEMNLYASGMSGFSGVRQGSISFPFAILVL